MKNHSPRFKIFLYLSIPIIFLAVFLLMLSHLAWAKKYETRIYPGIQINSLALGGLTRDEAAKKIDAQADQLEKGGLVFTLNGHSATVPSEIIGDSGEFTQEVFKFNRDLTLEKAFGQGRDNDWLTSFSRWILGDWHAYNLPAEYTLDSDVLTKVLKDDFNGQETVPQDAALKLNGRGELEVTPEQNGITIDYGQATKDAGEALKNMQTAPIVLQTANSQPSTTAESLTNLATEAKQAGDLAPIKVTAGDYFAIIDKGLLISWAKADESGHLTLDRDKIIAFINKSLAAQVDQEVKTPRFTIKDGKMSYWQAGEEGRNLDPAKSADQIIKNILSDKQKEITLQLDIVPFVSPDSGEVVIKELLGTGHSNFTGSPANRKKNIAVGSAAVQGLLIKPGEEFSLVKALGAVDESHGYLPELVIKEGKTIPEFGGGLCQVATTLFRAALATGLPITERQNHSYRVSYYEPAGTDAAVYDPQPDVRFINDTGNYVLIQTRTAKNDLYFEFWGVKDGRQATTTAPTIFNITKPDPQKTIVTTDLKPGEKKCTEKAHNGADAFFDYTVTYLNGTVKQKRFKSHYVPWQAVCMVGATSTAATTTEAIPAGN